MTNFPIPMRLAAVAAALLIFAGCGAMPVAPVLDDSAARVDVNGAAPQALTMPVDVPGEAGGGGYETPPETGPFDASAARTADLSSDAGGSVSNGRWRVVVPRGAFDGAARVSVSTSNTKSWDCQLGIAPSDKNHFEVPVLLVADCHNVPPHRLARWFISWYNPDTKTWQRVPGSIVDLKKKTVTAPLAHFSVYSVGSDEGKSGW